MYVYIYKSKVPAKWNRDGTFRHTLEGDDDMPGHVKSSLMGPSLTIPVNIFLYFNNFSLVWIKLINTHKECLFLKKKSSIDSKGSIGFGYMARYLFK